LKVKKYFGWLRDLKAFRSGKLFVKRMQGRELWLKPELRVPLHSIGFGDFCPDGLNSASVVYSLGVGDEINFDLAFMSAFGSNIYAFDPTPISIELVEQMSPPDGFKFYPWAVTGQDETIRFYPRKMPDGSISKVQYTIVAGEGATEQAVDVPGYTIATITQKLGHKSIDLMKMNIEGAEYDVLDSLLVANILPIQLIIEFHHRFANIGLVKTEQILKRLKASGYKRISISKSGRVISLLRQNDGGNQ